MEDNLAKVTKIAFVELSVADNVVDWTILKYQGLLSLRVISIIFILIAKNYLFIILIILAQPPDDPRVLPQSVCPTHRIAQQAVQDWP